MAGGAGWLSTTVSELSREGACALSRLFHFLVTPPRFFVTPPPPPPPPPPPSPLKATKKATLKHVCVAVGVMDLCAHADGKHACANVPHMCAMFMGYCVHYVPCLCVLSEHRE